MIGRTALWAVVGTTAVLLMTTYVWKDTTARARALVRHELVSHKRNLEATVERLRADTVALGRVERIKLEASALGLVTPPAPPRALSMVITEAQASEAVRRVNSEIENSFSRPDSTTF